jgi:hypothetical protein
VTGSLGTVLTSFGWPRSRTLLLGHRSVQLLPPGGPALPRSRLGSRVPALLSLVLGALLVLTLFASVSVAAGAERAPTDPGASSTPGDDLTTSGPAPLQARAAASSSPSGLASDTDVAAAEQAAEVEVPPPFAEVEGLELLLPSFGTVAYGFHEASWRGPVAMSPVGDRARVLPSRGRSNPPTSAVDIVLVDDDVVLSPVSGVVEQVEPFELYNRYYDRKITIVPDDAPHLRVVMIHVIGTMVEGGERVEAGVTELAHGARRFPFRSQVDELTAPNAWPHVHIEVKRADAG